MTLTEGVPARLAELLAGGELDVAVMAQPGGFDERFRAEVIYREQFVVACPYGHRFERLNAVSFEERVWRSGWHVRRQNSSGAKLSTIQKQ